MVEPETVEEVMYEGSSYPVKASRQSNGVWTVTFRANVRVLLGDRREVWVIREFRVRATDYKGHPPGKASAKYIAAKTAQRQSK